MSRIVIYTDSWQGTAITIQGYELRDALERLRAAGALHQEDTREIVVVERKPSALQAGDAIINLLPTETPKLGRLRRFGVGMAQVTVWCANPEEMDIPEVAQILLWHREGLIPGLAPAQGYSELQMFARTNFSPSMALRVMEGLHRVTPGVSPLFKNTGENDRLRWAVPANRWNVGIKRLDDHAAISMSLLNVLASRGEEQALPTFYLNHSPEANIPPRVAASGVYSVQVQPPTREAFAEWLRTCGMFVCLSRTEMFAVYPMELLACGAVGVFKREAWVEAMYPGYPFMAKSMAEVKEMALHVFDHYEESRKRLREYLEKCPLPTIDGYALSIYLRLWRRAA